MTQDQIQATRISLGLSEQTPGGHRGPVAPPKVSKIRQGDEVFLRTFGSEHIEGMNRKNMSSNFLSVCI